MIGRRVFLLGSIALASAGWAMPFELPPGRFERIRSRIGVGARLGIALFDTFSERTIGFDADSRYPLASTFKLPLVAAILDRVDREGWQLSRTVSFAASDLVDYAPVVRRRLARGRLRLHDLCAAALVESDNSAANLLLREIGGPESFNAFIRRCGDSVTRLDRYEPDLNSVDAGDERDSTTPAAMAHLVHKLMFGDGLSNDSQALLGGWAERARPLRSRLRADLSPRSGGEESGLRASGEISGFFSHGQGAIIVATYISGGDPRPIAHDAAHAAVVRAVAAVMPESALPADRPRIDYPIG